MLAQGEPDDPPRGHVSAYELMCRSAYEVICR
jgi:hypothetical protein